MKTKIKISKELRTFLKKKGALEQFIYNAQVLNSWKTKDVSVNIYNAFTWWNSPEGAMYWIKLSDEFNSI